MRKPTGITVELTDAVRFPYPPSATPKTAAEVRKILEKLGNPSLNLPWVKPTEKPVAIPAQEKHVELNFAGGVRRIATGATGIRIVRSRLGGHGGLAYGDSE